MFRSYFCTGDAAAADFDILEGRNIFSSGFQCRVSHVRVQGFGGFSPEMEPIWLILPVATLPITLLAKLPPLLTEEAYIWPADPSGCSIA